MSRPPLSVFPLEDRTVPSAYRFDFGTAESPVESGFTRVTASTAYSPVRGNGWISGDQLDFDRGTGTPVTRDFNYLTDATFAVDLPNGTYAVAVTMGDTGPYHHDFQGLFIEGSQVDSVSTVGGQVVEREYVATVADGQLTLRFRDLGGTNPHAVVMGVTVTPFVPPPVSSTRHFDFGTPSSPVADGFTRATDAVWSTATGFGWVAGDPLSFDRGIGNSLARDFVFATDATFEVQVPNGSYRVTVTVGDTGPYHHDHQGVYVEGELAALVSTAAAEVRTATHFADVTDGRLTLRLRDFGGSNPHVVLMGLTVEPAPAPPAVERFDIELVTSGLTARQREVFEAAAFRWQQVIVGDLPAVHHGSDLIDDMRVEILAVPMDGPFGVLGSAAVGGGRTGSLIPYYGVIWMDQSDVARLDQDGRLFSVALHEMGHTLGFGTIWEFKGLVSGAGTANPLFTGSQATAEYNARFGRNDAGVPLETGGGPGTAEGHWRQSVFGGELMVGWLGLGPRPLSRITVASFADLGYVVDFTAADPF